ncbi:MAG: hypothetical protein ACI9UN_004069, partial [Granulosicoccus sp.]
QDHRSPATTCITPKTTIAVSDRPNGERNYASSGTSITLTPPATTLMKSITNANIVITIFIYLPP